jgi:hypothetical protein
MYSTVQYTITKDVRQDPLSLLKIGDDGLQISGSFPC